MKCITFRKKTDMKLQAKIRDEKLRHSRKDASDGLVCSVRSNTRRTPWNGSSWNSRLFPGIPPSFPFFRRRQVDRGACGHTYPTTHLPHYFRHTYPDITTPPKNLKTTPTYLPQYQFFPDTPTSMKFFPKEKNLSKHLNENFKWFES